MRPGIWHIFSCLVPCPPLWLLSADGHVLNMSYMVRDGLGPWSECTVWSQTACVWILASFFFLKLWILLTSLWLCFLIQNQVYNNRTFYKIVVVMKLVNTSNGLKQYVEHSKCSVLALFFIHYLFSFSFFNILKLFLCGKNNLRCFLLIYLLK